MSKKVRKKKIQKVMLVGFTMNTFRYTDDSYCFFYYKLRIQVDILKILKKAGFYTIYKTHPDRILEIGNIMDQYADECISNSLEKIWNKADALIFTYTTTSTFGFALNTPLPIILTNERSTEWNYQRKLQIKKRVHILDYSYTQNSCTGLSPLKFKDGFVSAQKKILLDNY